MSGFRPVHQIRPGLACVVKWTPKLRQCLSTSDVFLSKPPRPARSPRSRLPSIASRSPQNDSPTRAPTKAKSPNPITDEVWPTAILQNAIRLGLLEIPTEKAVEFMQAFERRHPLTPEQVIKNHDLKAHDVTLLARVLLRTRYTKVARDMLLASARLNDEEAILLVTKEALRTDSFGAPGVDFVYQRCFKPLVKTNNATALYLEGQICERQGKSEKALELFGKLAASQENESIVEDDEIDFGTVWVAIGRLKARKGDQVGAEEAINTAALQYDNPTAYYQLAKLFAKTSFTEYENYLLKAAASGEIDAAHELGVLYLGQSQDGNSLADGYHQDEQEPFKEIMEGKTPKIDEKLAATSSAAMEKLDKARHWFELGAFAGLTGSQVYLAALLHKIGEVKKGWGYLEAASKSKDFSTWAKPIGFLKKHWDSADLDISRIHT